MSLTPDWPVTGIWLSARRSTPFWIHDQATDMVSFDAVEQLKRSLTDKFVIVDTQSPELRRFVGLTGRVKTVNMSGRALVQFDGPVDIGWYDIDPSYLTVVDQPLPKKVAEAKPAEASAKKAPAAKPTGGKSPLELAREQAAAKAAGGAAKPAAAKPAGGMSPLEMARAQGAAKSGGAAPAKPTGGKSPLELAREQGAAKSAKGAAAPPAAETPPPAAAPATPAPAPAASLTDENGKPLSKIELARRQGAFKGK